MKLSVVILSFFCLVQMSYSQEQDGMVALTIPVRNSLTFNRYVINPTFSFVREQNKYVSIYNKREWVQFEDAPQTYLASFAGRFKENIGAGIGLFQQNNGVLTTFGGIANFAYNIRLTNDTNLTFGLNVGAYKSGINTGSVITNVQETNLDNIPSSFMLTVNPGINYGTTFFDFGLSVNNLVQYDFETSTLYKDSRERGIQAHAMYTGFMSSRGFFDNSKFSGLIRSEFLEDETIISGTAMLTVPKGIWAQVGYNNMYGAFGGVGINLTNQIAMEYSFERTVGELSQFGPSHEVTLAYKFNNRDRFDYSGDEEIAGLISGGNKKKRVVRRKNSNTSDTNITALPKEEREAKRAEFLAEQKARKEALAERAADAEAKRNAKREAQISKKNEEDTSAKKRLEDEQAIKEVEAQNKAEAAEKARLEAENRAKTEAEKKAELEKQRKAKAEADRLARLEAFRKAKKEEEERARLEAEKLARQKVEAEEQARLEQERIAKEQAEESARVEAERLAREAEAKAQKEAEEDAKRDAEQLAKEQAAAKAKTEEDALKTVLENTKNTSGQSLKNLDDSIEASKTAQEDLLKRFNEIVAVKDQDLKDLKKENDLGEQGIATAPKPFKSISEENNRLRAIKTDLDKVIESRDKKIKELEDLFEDNFESDTLYNSTVMLQFKKKIKKLKSEQAQTLRTKSELESNLKAIDIAMDFERKRRIKRAVYSNEDDRYNQDRQRLDLIKKNTPLSDFALTKDDFDSGEELSDGIQILKNVNNVEEGYYLIVAAHKDVEKRDKFVKNAVAAGRRDIDFFFDVNTGTYYIYYKKAERLDSANAEIANKGTRPYNQKMSIVKIEN